MGLDDGASPHSARGSYIHSSASPPPYLSSRSPNPMSQNHHFTYSDNIVYTALGKWSNGKLSLVRRNKQFCKTFYRQPCEFDVAFTAG